jgi:hypothetical protein
MRRIFSVLAVAALMAAMMVTTALPAFADKGGVPNENACHGQNNKALNSFGLTPPETAQLFGFDNAGDYNKLINKDFCG